MTRRPRHLSPVEQMPLVGGRLCLDFVNTTGARASSTPRERLAGYRELVVWSRRAKLLRPAQARALERAGAAKSAAAHAALLRVRAIRELLYRLLRAAAERRAPEADDVAGLDRLWRRDRDRRALVVSGHALAVRLQPSDGELDVMIWPLVESAVELLTSDDVERLKRCGDCDWLFVDETKNGSRTFCKTDCRDRVRARRYYGRVRRRRTKGRGLGIRD